MDLDGLIAVVRNKSIRKLTRDDTKLHIEKCLKSGSKTTTVRRRLRSFSAIVNLWIRERDTTATNAFSGLRIKNEGKDSRRRVPVSMDSLEALYQASRAADDDIRWLSAMLMDTGARISEVAGLLIDDIKLKGPVPHVIFRPHPWRSIKTEDRREVPLVGTSLWAATRVVESAIDGQRFAFPRYARCKGNHASKTLNDWIKPGA